MSPNRPSRWCAALLKLALLTSIVGCSAQEESLPPTYPVTGSVLMEKGAILKGGSLQFRPDNNADLTVVGDIAGDGTFRLRTLKGSKVADGAPAGTYEVTVIPPLGPDRKPLFATFVVSQKYKVEPEVNHFQIRADEP